MSHHHRYVGETWEPDIVTWRTYEKGTLILDIVDPTTKSLMWRGFVEGEVRDWKPQEK